MERIDLDVAQIRAIVEAERQKAGTEAGPVRDVAGRPRASRPVALGNSMTTVPATTDMHYRIGITETFQSTLVMMLAEQGRLNLTTRSRAGFPTCSRLTR